jgi:hypothetical protein
LGSDGGHHASGQIGIEFVVARENGDVFPKAELIDLEVGLAHFDAELFRFFGSSDDASIVVAEHNDGAVG